MCNQTMEFTPSWELPAPSLQSATKVGFQVTGRSGFNSFSNLKIVSLQNAPNLVGSQPLPIAFQTIFVTSVSYSGKLGGLAGADALCADRAAHGLETLSLGRTWRAILSSSWLSATVHTPVNAKDRISLIAGAPIKNTHGDTVIANASGLWGSALNSAPGYDEFGTAVTGAVWTGSTSSGISDGEDCANWTDGSGSGTGEAGSSNVTTSNWFDYTTQDGCDWAGRLFCINTNN